jgi:hypothetical protein
MSGMGVLPAVALQRLQNDLKKGDSINRRLEAGRTIIASSSRSPAKIKDPPKERESDALAAEVEALEAKLKNLREQRGKEDQHWGSVKRTKDGALWKGGRPVINHTKKFLAKVSETNRRREQAKTPKKAKTRSTRASPGPATPSASGPSMFLTAIEDDEPVKKKKSPGKKKSNPKIATRLQR